jgi:hypothetical protein
MINHRHVIDRLTTFIQSCRQHWDVCNDCRRHDSRQRRIWEKNSRSKTRYIFDSISISNSSRKRFWKTSTTIDQIW